ncbi:hypothetical protein FB451DRAFT_1184683 [Mycena latifolia]|nr:hypothetical protein FB451DRAFT_1184683 [Mycena latifolia]
MTLLTSATNTESGPQALKTLVSYKDQPVQPPFILFIPARPKNEEDPYDLVHLAPVIAQHMGHKSQSNSQSKRRPHCYLVHSIKDEVAIGWPNPLEGFLVTPAEAKFPLADLEYYTPHSFPIDLPSIMFIRTYLSTIPFHQQLSAAGAGAADGNGGRGDDGAGAGAGAGAGDGAESGSRSGRDDEPSPPNNGGGGGADGGTGGHRRAGWEGEEFSDQDSDALSDGTAAFISEVAFIADIAGQHAPAFRKVATKIQDEHSLLAYTTLQERISKYRRVVEGFEGSDDGEGNHIEVLGYNIRAWDRYQLNSLGSGCRFWCLTAMNDLEEVGFVKGGTGTRITKCIQQVHNMYGNAWVPFPLIQGTFY